MKLWNNNKNYRIKRNNNDFYLNINILNKK